MEKLYFFDPDGMGFYVSPDSQVIPVGSVEISFDTYSQFAGVAWPESKIMGSDNDGMPAWVDAPPLTKEEQTATAEAKKQTLIDRANEYINSRQWPSKLALGRLSDDGKFEFNLWLDYLDALEAVDTSTVPVIVWPEMPA